MILPSSHVYGYHGTYRKAAGSILEMGYDVSNNNYDWLGKGIYFFQDGLGRAAYWAKQKCRTRRLPPSDAVVLRSTISLEKCFDLVDIGCIELLTDGFNAFQAFCLNNRLDLPKQGGKRNRLDCAVINYTIQNALESRGESIHSVRSVFEEDEPVYPSSAITRRGHIQIAVRDKAMVSDTQIITMEGENYVY